MIEAETLPGDLVGQHYERPLRRTGTRGRRLFGWQLNPERRVTRELQLGPDGRIWSVHLE